MMLVSQIVVRTMVTVARVLRVMPVRVLRLRLVIVTGVVGLRTIMLKLRLTFEIAVVIIVLVIGVIIVVVLATPMPILIARVIMVNGTVI